MSRADLWELLACPTCGGSLTGNLGVSAACASGHRFSAQGGVLEFAQKPIVDKYDEVSMSRQYVQYAFGYRIMRDGSLGKGTSEGLYRTVSDVTCRELLEQGLSAPFVVDLACGVGRTVHDLARVFPAGRFVGIDLSRHMASTAARLSRGEVVEAGTGDDGWPTASVQLPEASNALIVQGDAAKPPLAACHGGPGADVVLCNMLIDRMYEVASVTAALDAAVAATRPGGILVVTSPFNWVTNECWAEFGGDPSWLLTWFGSRGWTVELSFGGLVYREALDPVGTSLELLVNVITARRA